MSASSTFTYYIKSVTGDLERGFQRSGTESKKLGHDLDKLKGRSLAVREASIKVEQAQRSAARATERYGKESLQAAAAQVRLERAQEKANRATQTGTRHAGVLAGSLKKAAGAAVALGAGYASIQGAKDAISTTEELGHATLKLHKNFGLSIKSAGEFAAVMKAREIDAKQGAQAFGTFSKQMIGLSEQSAGAVKVFDRLGIAQKDLAGKDFAQRLALVSDRFKDLGPGPTRVATGMQLFGRGWQNLLPLIGSGSAALKSQLALTERYGATLGGTTVKQVEKLLQAQREQKYAMLGIQVTLGKLLIPALTWLTTKTNSAVLAVRDFIGQLRTGDRGARGASSSMRSLAKSFDDATSGARDAYNALRPLIRPVLSGLAQGARGTATAIGGFGKIVTGVLHGDVGDAFRGLKAVAKGGLDGVIGMLKLFTLPARKAGLAIGRAIRSGVSSAFTAATGFVGDIGHSIAKWLNDNTPFGDKVNIGPVHFKIPALARGGAITGGVQGRDSVPAMLMPGEHVLTSKEVRNAGGHGAIFAMRRALGGGGQGGGGLFAAGGAIESMKSAAWRIASKGYDYAYGGGHGGIGSPGYDIRGNGKFGFDCSGYVSAILGAGGVIGSPMAVRQPLQGALLPANGPNDGPVVVGIRGTSALNAHTMMRIGSSYYESGSGHGPRKVGGWSGSFDWFKPAGMSTAGGKDAKASGNPGGSGGGKTKVKRTRGFKPTGSSFVPSTAEGRYQTALATPGAGDDLWAANAGLNGANSEVRRASKLVAAGLASPSLLSDAMTRRDTWAQRVTDATEAGGNPLIAANIGGALMGPDADATSGSASSSGDLLQGIKDELAAMNKRAEQIAQTTGGDVIRGLIHEFATTGVGTSFNLANQSAGRGAGAHASY